ncbi:MAG: RagB/SusD family nutrient uptake outer membrane protein [Bacteroidales bacterium]
MNKILHIILIIASLGIIQGCGDYLDNPPKGMTIPSKCEDYEKLLNNQGLLNGLSEELEYLTDNVHLINKDKAASGYIFINKSDKAKNIYSFAPGQIDVPGSKDYIWDGAYSNLFTLNAIINGVMESTGSTTEKKLRIKSEALFARAFEYFNLVNIYGAQYDKATSAKDYGVPYIKEADINQKYTRQTVAQVYENIFADLKEAETGLAVTVPNKAHPNKAALSSFYARLYLTMGDYTKALENANAALNVNDKLLNLNDYMMQDGTTWDRVVLKTDKTKRLPDIDHPEANYFKTYGGRLQGEVMLNTEFRDLFKKDVPTEAKDLRKEYFYAEDEVNLGGSTDYFPGECAYVLYTTLNIGFTSTENYLIAAECEARIGSKDRAMELINKLRDNRFENNVALTASSNDEALVKVLDERRKELAMKGFRLFDLKRLNKEAKFAKTITHTADGETWTLAPNDPKYIFPINQEILNFYPDMPQYDRK